MRSLFDASSTFEEGVPPWAAVAQDKGGIRKAGDINE